jgi:hypothetical protein
MDPKNYHCLSSERVSRQDAFPKSKKGSHTRLKSCVVTIEAKKVPGWIDQYSASGFFVWTINSDNRRVKFFSSLAISSVITFQILICTTLPSSSFPKIASHCASPLIKALFKMSNPSLSAS